MGEVEYTKNTALAENLGNDGYFDNAKLDKAVSEGKISQELANKLKMGDASGKNFIKLSEKKFGPSDIKQKSTSKAKQMLKKLFSKEGGAFVAQALTVAGTIAAQIEAPKCSSNCKKGGAVDFQMSQRAQKIVAQTMGKMR